MPEVASWSLQRGVYQALAGSVDLTTLLGGIRVYGDAPQAAPYPFITLGQSVVRDWSTGTEDGAEHDLTLHVWSRSGGKKQVHQIIEAIRTVLHDQYNAACVRIIAREWKQVSRLRCDTADRRRSGVVSRRWQARASQPTTSSRRPLPSTRSSTVSSGRV